MITSKLTNRVFVPLTPPVITSIFKQIASYFSWITVKSKLSKHNRLHLASGKNILDNWANIDLNNHPGTIKYDLTKCLPVASHSVDFIFCEHFIEHISFENSRKLIQECYRTLSPNGVLRFSTPDLKKLILEYSENRIDEWHDVGWKPESACQMMNEGMRSWGHLFIYDLDELKKILTQCGFEKINVVEWKKSDHPELNNLECRPYNGEIIIEATK